MHAMHGSTKQFRSSVPFRRGVVREVNGTTSTVFDITSNSPFEAMNVTASGRRPEVGDVWMLSSETGHWTFSHLLLPASSNRLITSMDDLITSMDGRNDINWAPHSNRLRSAVEMPAGAFIGEHRFFDVPPGDGWVKLDGSAVSRKRYRPYWELIGTSHGAGDGSTTFNVPYVPTPTTGRQSIKSVTKTLTADYIYTTTVGSAISGFSHAITIPAGVDPTNVVVRVNITMGLIGDSSISNTIWVEAAVPYLDGSQWLQDSRLRQIEWLTPVASTLSTTLSSTWEFTFSTTGAHTIEARGWKTSTSSLVYASIDRSTMVIDEFYVDSNVASAGWYVRAA